METESGRSLHRFFDRWIYGTTLPRLTFTYRIDGSDVVLHVEQVGELFDFPLTVTLQYQPPAGKVGALVAKLFGREPQQTVREDLRRLKQLLEAGEIAKADADDGVSAGAAR